MTPLKVGAVMTKPVVALDRDHSIHLATSLMRLKHIRHLPVTDGDGNLVGIVTARDLVRAQADVLARAHTARELSVPVSRVMSDNVWAVHPDTPVLEAARIMSDHKFGCVPVLEGRRLVGILTEADLIHVLLRLLERGREREDTDPRITLEQP